MTIQGEMFAKALEILGRETQALREQLQDIGDRESPEMAVSPFEEALEVVIGAKNAFVSKKRPLKRGRGADAP